MRSNDALSAAGGPSWPAPFSRLLAGALVSLGVTAGLLAMALRVGRDVATLVGSGSGVSGALALARVEDLVAGVALLVALALATWLSVALTTAAACVGARELGHRWRLGEELVARTAPAVVRRAVALSAGTSVALATAALPASAEVAPPPPVDLGWNPTVSAPAWSAPPTAVPPDDVRAADPVPAGGGGNPAVGAPGQDDRTDRSAPGVAGPTGDAVPGTTGPTGGAEGGTPPSSPPSASAESTDLPASPPALTVDASPTAPGAPPGTAGRPLTSRAEQDPPGVDADGAQPLHASADDTASTPRPGPLRVVDSSASSGPPIAASADGQPASATVTVHPGDTLWGIAADSLPTGATAQDVATAWPQWYAANRHVLGPDPDLIHPGQRLVRPSTTSGAATTPVPDTVARTDGAGS